MVFIGKSHVGIEEKMTMGETDSCLKKFPMLTFSRPLLRGMNGAICSAVPCCSCCLFYVISILQ